jgi:UDP-glucose 4-epimerase
MKILFTGASSLTGMWFVQELVYAGHEVIACYRSELSSYQGLRRQRIDRIAHTCHQQFNCPFGSEAFLNLIKNYTWDLFCHHAADVANYKSLDFDVSAALGNNTRNMKKVLEQLREKGCRKILLTGSVFEQGEGIGSEELRAVSPYGLSKGLTSACFNFYASLLGLKLGKFVIPNPFGPFEEIRYTSYLAQAWFAGHSPSVNTPDYIRDNIPVSLLAKAYAAFAIRLSETAGFEKTNPSFYRETQGLFTKRFAHEMASRLNLACRYDLKKQVEFAEPLERVNSQPLDHQALGWSESQAWDELAHYYKATYGQR